MPLIKVVENEVYLPSERQKRLLSPLYHLITEPATMRVSEARQWPERVVKVPGIKPGSPFTS